LLNSFSLYAAPKPCDSAPHRAFDFWLDQWKVTTTNDNVVRKNNISLINDGCTLLEEYSTPSLYQGKSLTMYDSQRKQWHQTWTDNSGLILLLSGQYSNNVMTMQGETIQNGILTMNKITWTNNLDGTVRQHWQSKASNEKNWKTIFDGLYTN